MKISLLYLSVFVWYILLTCSYPNAGTHASILKSGPYRSTVTRSEKCKNPAKPYEKNPSSLFYSDIYTVGNRTLISGNLTVIKVNTNMKIQAKGFMLEDGKRKIIYIANSVGCHGLLINVWKIALDAQQYEGCIPKESYGSYIFKDLDFDYIQQMWMKTFMYGKFIWRLTVASKAGTTICWEFDAVTEPKP